MISVNKGSRGILLSAPHVFKHYRRNLDKVLKQGEPWTDTIVKDVAKNTESNSILIEKDIDFDPNFDIESENEYKSKVKSIIKELKVKTFIDVHGLSDKHEYDFGIFFPLRYTNSKKLAYDIAQELSKGLLRNSLVFVLNLKDNNQETLTEFVVQKLKVTGVQLEVARYIREDESLRNEVIEAISRVLLKY